MTARLHNRALYMDCLDRDPHSYRGLVVLHDDGRMTWLDSGVLVAEWRGDYLTQIKDRP